MGGWAKCAGCIDSDNCFLSPNDCQSKRERKVCKLVECRHQLEVFSGYCTNPDCFYHNKLQDERRTS